MGPVLNNIFFFRCRFFNHSSQFVYSFCLNEIEKQVKFEKIRLIEEEEKTA